MVKRNDNVVTLDELIDKEYGVKGTAKRAQFEKGYEEFKSGALIHGARIAKVFTQTQLEDKCGTTKAP